MQQLKPGDVIAFEFNGKYYYAIILTIIIMFGGNLVYAFPLVTNNLIKLDELLSLKTKGFNAIVDFIFAKRENRITKLGQVKDCSRFILQRYFKACNEINTKALNWFIYDENNKLVKRTSNLTQEEKAYPFRERIDDTLLVERVTDNWLSETDKRI